jgi:hypothetical protein
MFCRRFGSRSSLVVRPSLIAVRFSTLAWLRFCGLFSLPFFAFSRFFLWAFVYLLVLGTPPLKPGLLESKT